MPAAALLLPLALLASGALLAWLAGLLGAGSRLIAATAMVGALIALIAVWTPQREPLELLVGEVGAGIRIGLRLDAVSFAFALFILTPAALLVAFLRPPAPALTALGTATSVLTVLASGLLFAAFAWGVTLTVYSLLIQASGEEMTTRSRLRGQAAWLCLIWAAAVLSGRAGTDQFAAIPVSAVQGAVFLLVAVAAVLGSGLLPWRPWPAELWLRLRPRIAGSQIPLLYFTGFYLLVRMYQAGGGHYPLALFNYALVALGAACALGAAMRSQAAPDRSGYFAEALPLTAGFALIALGLGTPLGLAAAMATLASAALLAALLPLVGEAELSPSVLLGLLVCAGLPPGALFATRLLDLQAAIEAGEVMGYLSLVGAAAWVITVAGAARAARLASAPVPERASGTPAAAIGLLLALGGTTSGLVQSTIALPAAAAVLSFPDTALTGLPLQTAAASGTWPAVGLGGIVALALAVLIGAAWRKSPGRAARLADAPAAGEPALFPPSPPAPFLQAPWQGWLPRLQAIWAAMVLPPEFRVTAWSRIEAAMTRQSVWLWLGLLAVTAYLVLRA